VATLYRLVVGGRGKRGGEGGVGVGVGEGVGGGLRPLFNMHDFGLCLHLHLGM